MGVEEEAGVRVGQKSKRVVSGGGWWDVLWWRAVCWAVQEAARSGGEELMGVSMGAQGGSRAVGMWEGAAILVAVYYERVASGGGWRDVHCYSSGGAWRCAVGTHLGKASSVALSRPG